MSAHVNRYNRGNKQLRFLKFLKFQTSVGAVTESYHAFNKIQ